MRLGLFWLLQWTWGLPQNLLGLLLYLRYGGAGHSIYRGTVVKRWPHPNSLSLGMFLFLSPHAAPPLRVHEYGHSLQSLILGPFYLLLVGLPSLLWCNLPILLRWRQRRRISYYALYPENWANRLGKRMTGEEPPEW